MNFVDATLVRLADPATRVAIFDQVSLEQLLNSAFDTQSANLEGPYQPLFDEFQVGFSVTPIAMATGHWCPTGGTKVDASFQMTGMTQPPEVRVDAKWRGSIVARAIPPTGEISGVDIDWPAVTTIDSEIVAVLGELPSDPTILEQQRRSRLMTHVKAGLDQAEMFSETRLDQWLSRQGVSSVGDLVQSARSSTGGVVQVSFTPPLVAAPVPVTLPFSAGVLIRDQNFSLSQLLTDSKSIREHFRTLGLERTGESPLNRLRSSIVVWIIPESVFDDADWPGGDTGADPAAKRVLRRAAAGKWLAQEGIGLVTVGGA